MRNIFIIAAKIIGLWQACQLANKIPDIFLLDYTSLLQKDFLGIVLPMLFLLVLAYVLIFKTGWIADMAGLSENKESPDMTRNDLLAVGIKLLGVYWAFAMIMFIVFTIYFYFAEQYGSFERANFSMTGGFASFVTFILSMLFIFKTNTVVDMLTRAENVAWKKLVLVILLVLGFMAGMQIAKMLRLPKDPYAPTWNHYNSDDF